MFHIHWDQSDLGAIQNAVMATFFDIYEDVSRVWFVFPSKFPMQGKLNEWKQKRNSGILYFSNAPKRALSNICVILTTYVLSVQTDS